MNLEAMRKPQKAADQTECVTMGGAAFEGGQPEGEETVGSALSVAERAHRRSSAGRTQTRMRRGRQERSF